MSGVPRRTAVWVVALAAVAGTGWLAKLPSVSASERARVASSFSFRRLELPVAAKPVQSVRQVEPQLRHIAAWISSVGAAVSLSDLDGDGRSNDVCLVDPRSDRVTVAPAPGTGRRSAPFTLDAAPLRYDRRTMAPMGCLPGDFDEDGRLDLLVYYWGRTPVLFLRRGATLGPHAFLRRELVPGRQRWYTDTITSADVDGDGHYDLIVGNYFPDGARLLDPRATHDPAMQMQDSMSLARNGGVDRILLWRSPGRFVDVPHVFSNHVAKGWTLAAGAADLDGDLRPELYFANDFGPDRLLHNTSTPGRVRLQVDQGTRSWSTPKSKVLGHDSFKGMGIDFGDLNGDGRLDFFVSNITSPYALEESNFAFIGHGPAAELAHGQAPFVDRSEPLGLSRSGWGWDAKLGDFNGDGVPEIVQARGFMRGTVNRWPQLHELAMTNDTLLRHPSAWPNFRPGDDLDGHQDVAFFARASSGRYVDVAHAVGVSASSVTRGIATADVNGDGRLDFAVAGQWGPSYLFLNHGPRHPFFGVRLLLPPGGAHAPSLVFGGLRGGLRARPAIGAEVTVEESGRRYVAQVDGGNGHASVRGNELLFPAAAHDQRVALAWRDGFGIVRRHTFVLSRGWHTIVLAQGPHA